MDTALLDLPDSADATLSETVACRRTADAAEARIVQLAVAWADQHPTEDPREAAWEDTVEPGRTSLPRVDESAIPELAAALGVSTPGATRLVHESLELCHRLPRHWAALAVGEVQAWRARRIAQQTLSQLDDVTEYVDEVLATRANRVGVIAIRVDAPDAVAFADVVRDWAGRPDMDVTVQPVLDVADHRSSEAYTAPLQLRRQVRLQHPHCAFPYCERASERCDLDHLVPYDAGGSTCSCNLVPLCRRHHRLKTFTGWRYDVLGPTSVLWTSPHRRRYLVDDTGSRDVTDTARARRHDRDLGPPGDGCHSPLAG